MRKNETPEMLLWEEMAKTYFSKGLKDIDLSYLNVGDILHLTNIAIHTLPDGDKCCVCKSVDGHIIPPAILLRSGNGIKYTTKDFIKCTKILLSADMTSFRALPGKQLPARLTILVARSGRKFSRFSSTVQRYEFLIAVYEFFTDFFSFDVHFF